MKTLLSERNQTLLILVLAAVAFIVFGIYGLHSINHQRRENQAIRSTLSQGTPTQRRLPLSTADQEAFEEIRTEWREVFQQAGFFHVYSQRHDPTLKRQAKIQSIVEQMQNRLYQWVSDGTIAYLDSATLLDLSPYLDEEGAAKPLFWEIPMDIKVRLLPEKLGLLLQTCGDTPSPFVLRSIRVTWTDDAPPPPAEEKGAVINSSPAEGARGIAGVAPPSAVGKPALNSPSMEGWRGNAGMIHSAPPPTPAPKTSAPPPSSRRSQPSTPPDANSASPPGAPVSRPAPSSLPPTNSLLTINARLSAIFFSRSTDD